MDLCPLIIFGQYNFSLALWWPLEALKTKWPPALQASIVIFANSYEYGHVVPQLSWIFVLLPYLTNMVLVKHSDGHYKPLYASKWPLTSQVLVEYFSNGYEYVHVAPRSSWIFIH